MTPITTPSLAGRAGSRSVSSGGGAGSGAESDREELTDGGVGEGELVVW